MANQAFAQRAAAHDAASLTPQDGSIDASIDDPTDGRIDASIDASMDGYAVFNEMDRRHNRGYGDFEVAVAMQLVRRPGAAPVQRQLRIRQVEDASGDKAMVVFDAPAAIKGTALLTHTKADKDDDQWLFLPAFKRVKKITTRNKSGAFVQSEFSYEDLSIPQLHKYSFRRLGEQRCGSLRCLLVERVANTFESGYSREVYWIDDTEFRAQRVEYFDGTGAALKVLEMSDYRPYGELLWKPHRMRMHNLQSERTTTLEWGEYQFRQGLQAQRDFTVAALRRQR